MFILIAYIHFHLLLIYHQIVVCQIPEYIVQLASIQRNILQ